MSRRELRKELVKPVWEEKRNGFGWIGNKRRKESRKSRKIKVGKDSFKKKTN